MNILGFSIFSRSEWISEIVNEVRKLIEKKQNKNKNPHQI